jgi:Domain of unknown function (DUF4124)
VRRPVQASYNDAMATAAATLMRVLGRATPVVLAGLLAQGVPVAQAEIYTWVDASGSTNISNLPPPEGTKVTKVQHALPPEIAAREDAAREAAQRAEAQALTERVRQLEDEARRMPPPDYRPFVPPPVIQYIVEPQPAPMQQTIEMTQPSPYGGYGGCIPSWAGCALSWFYPASVFVVPATTFRSVHPGHGGHNMNGMAPPVTQPRLPPPFGPPLVPQFTPAPAHAAAAQQVMRSFNPMPGSKRG